MLGRIYQESRHSNLGSRRIAPEELELIATRGNRGHLPAQHAWWWPTRSAFIGVCWVSRAKDGLPCMPACEATHLSGGGKNDR